MVIISFFCRCFKDLFSFYSIFVLENIDFFVYYILIMVSPPPGPLRSFPPPFPSKSTQFLCLLLENRHLKMNNKIKYNKTKK